MLGQVSCGSQPLAPFAARLVTFRPDWSVVEVEEPLLDPMYTVCCLWKGQHFVVCYFY